MNIRILGSAAGGGFPQWNCNCPNCDGVRRGRLNARARTQSSIAIRGADACAWLLLNASPDILAQLAANPQLQPARGPRDTGIRSVMLTDSQIDHTTGLLMLRESAVPWPLWCTDGVFDDLTQSNPLLAVLQHYCGVNRQRIPLDRHWFTIDGIEDIRWQAIALPGKPPAYSRQRDAIRTEVTGDVIGLLAEDTTSRQRLFYAPGLAAIEPHAWELMQTAQCVLVDGTFWTEDEMREVGVGHKRAAQMGHLPQSGEHGLISWLDRLPAATRRILVHINNTNPILLEDSPQRELLRTHRIEVAYDAMEIEL